ncbi:MAG: hypothetical protein IRZ16_22625 [Myxococcaceae bacterium]|nr:hypothetical protein [Myxococcaceae bacterium]
MHRRLHLTARSRKQTSPTAFAEAERAARALAAKWPEVQLLNPGGMVRIIVEDMSSEAAKDVLETFRHLAAHVGLEYQHYGVVLWDPEDFAQADFVACVGVSLDGTPDGPFVVNEKEALRPAPPDPRCGHALPMARIQEADLRVREAALLGPGDLAESRQPAPPGGWDAVTLVTGGLVVSTRFLAVLKREGATGYHTRPVIAAETGSPSARAVQLLPDRIVCVPCPGHTEASPPGPCPFCGIQRGQLEGREFRPRSQVDGVSLFVADPFPLGMIAFSRSLLTALEREGIRTLAPIVPLLVCDD